MRAAAPLFGSSPSARRSRPGARRGCARGSLRPGTQESLRTRCASRRDGLSRDAPRFSSPAESRTLARAVLHVRRCFQWGPVCRAVASSTLDDRLVGDGRFLHRAIRIDEGVFVTTYAMLHAISLATHMPYRRTARQRRKQPRLGLIEPKGDGRGCKLALGLREGDHGLAVREYSLRELSHHGVSVAGGT